MNIFELATVIIGSAIIPGSVLLFLLNKVSKVSEIERGVKENKEAINRLEGMINRNGEAIRENAKAISEVATAVGRLEGYISGYFGNSQHNPKKLQED